MNLVISNVHTAPAHNACMAQWQSISFGMKRPVVQSRMQAIIQ
jgi:hypothetical protein